MDLDTMATVLTFVALVLTVVLVLMVRLAPRYNGPGWWATGQGLLTIGYALQPLRSNSTTGQATIVLMGIALLAGRTMMLVGTASFQGRRPKWSVAVLVVIGAAMLFALLTLGFDDLRPRRAFFLAVDAAMLTVLAVSTWRGRRRRSVHHGVAVVSGICAVLATCHLGVALAVAINDEPLLADPNVGTITTVYVFVTIASMVLLTLGFGLLLNERLQAELAEQAETITRVFETSPDATLVTRLRDNAIIQVNTAFTTMTGYTREETIGHSSNELGLWVDPTDRDRLLAEVLTHGYVENFAWTSIRKDGSLLDASSSAQMMLLGNEPHLISVTRDFTSQRVLERELLQQASTDDLTHVANRRRFLAEAEQLVATARQQHTGLCLVLIDLDHFKEVNDTYGHAVGDRAAAAFAESAIATVRSNDFLGRIGGDEFGLLLPASCPAAAVATTDRIRLNVTQHPVIIDDVVVPITFSAGVSLFDADNDSLDSLLSRTDEALYAAKREGRNRTIVA